MKNKLMLRSRGGTTRGPGLAALALAIVWLAGCSAKINTDAQTPSVTASNVALTAAQREKIHTYRVQPSEFHKSVEVTGTVDFDQNQSTSVLAPFSGPVSELLVSLGEEVKVDMPLAKVASPDFATAISTYRKAIATARTARRLADLDQTLLPRHGVSQKEADQAESDALNAEADREAALQQLVSLRVDPETIKAIQDGKPVGQAEGLIRSPIAGTVAERLITPGQLLQAGSTACFTIANLSNVWVMAHVFESDLGSVSAGDPAEVLTASSSNSISGTVDNIGALVDPDTRSVQVRVVARNPGNVLKKNMYVRVRIQSRQTSTGLLVPVSAILRDSEDLPFVYAAQPDGSFARRQVTLGYRADDRYEIPSGLNGGEEVVTDGGLFIQFVQNQ
jgi:cobalt-zinc-cadmium efflux system membrane fusion protein